MRLGLGLSGGGFRASFYHLGVLAQMADRDLLREVQVISTVSGGSIIGALYYVYLKKLLESKYDRNIQGHNPEELISQKDYIKLVNDMAEHFREAVQTNIRLRTFSNPLKNLKMMRRSYSRSDRIAELYDKLLYSPALGLSENERAKMSDLYIQPHGTGNSFDPAKDNSNRGDQVPILLLNGTCLNSGHNWRFEAKTMGEPETVVPGVDQNIWANKIDKNFRLERPERHDNYKRPKRPIVKLGSAVAASATVPGLFPPMSISNMYHPDEFRIQVVDGGVHDNQGILGLEYEQCDHFIISDASGQMRDDASPSPSALSVVGRTNGIMMDRIREEQLFRLIQRVGNDQVAYMSLRQGLPRKNIPYVKQDKKPNGYTDNNPDGNLKHWPDFERDKPTDPGVDYHAQDLLSHVRTDLDTFTDIEAFSLMANGYMISEKEFADKTLFKSPARAPDDENLAGDKRFKECLKWLKKPDGHWKEHMEVAGETVFKVFRLKPIILGVPLAVFLLSVFYWAWDYIDALLSQPMWVLVIPLLVIALGMAIPWLGKTFKFIKWIKWLIGGPGEFFRRALMDVTLPVIGGIFVWLYLQTLDKLFVCLGRIKTD